MVRTKRTAFRILAFALLMALLAPAASAQTTLRLLWWVAEDGSAGWQNEMALIRLFEEHHPDIKVEVMFADWNTIPDQTITLSAAGQAPDVVWIREDSFYDLATRGLLMDLGPFIAKDPDFDPNNFLPGVFESARVHGVQYALHRDVWAPTIHYNRSWFQEAGLADPQPGWTYFEFLDIARRLSNPDQLKFGLGAIDSNRAGVLLSWGASLMNEDQTEFLLTSDRMIEAVTFMHSWRWVYHAEPRPGELADWYEPQWVRGDVAMNFWGPWAWPNYKQIIDFDWDVAPPLHGPAGAAVYLDGLLLGVSSQTKHPDEAWKLVRFLGYDVRAQAEQVRRGMASPTTRYPEALQAFFESENAPRTVQNYILNLQSGRPGYPRIPMTIKAVIDEAFNAILNDTQAVTSALSDAQNRATAMLQEIRNR